MTAVLTFSPGQVLMFAIIALALVLVAIWGVFEGEHDRIERERKRQLKREVRRQP